MSLMVFMEMMTTGNAPYLAAFFIGLMNAISPCPMAANITAIAYISRKIDDSKHTIIVGSLYTLGRMFTYIVLASMIIWFGLNTQIIALTLQRYGDKILGPFLILLSLIMFNIIRFSIFQKNKRFNAIKEKLSEKGYLGSFLLGAILALAFCPFSAVLFFGMLIPIAISAGDGILLPSIFAIGTGLPVMIFSLLLVYGFSKLGKAMNYVKKIDKIIRFTTAAIIMAIGIYYVIRLII